MNGETTKPGNGQEFNKPKNASPEATPTQGRDMEFLVKASRYAAARRDLLGGEASDDLFDYENKNQISKLGKPDVFRREDPKEFGGALCTLAREYSGFNWSAESAGLDPKDSKNNKKREIWERLCS